MQYFWVFFHFVKVSGIPAILGGSLYIYLYTAYVFAIRYILASQQFSEWNDWNHCMRCLRWNRSQYLCIIQGNNEWHPNWIYLEILILFSKPENTFSLCIFIIILIAYFFISAGLLKLYISYGGKKELYFTFIYSDYKRKTEKFSVILIRTHSY